MTKTGRREFLALMGSIAAGAMTGVFSESSAQSTDQYALKPWAGDDFTLGHKLRDGDLPKLPLESERKVDFVIIGGGMAGLACAHFLRNENVLLLEQYAQTGGTSSGGSYRGIDYSMGAVCTGSNDGNHKKLYDELNIAPAVVPEGDIAWRYDGHWQLGQTGAGNFYKELSRLKSELHGADRTKLDKTTFKDWLSSSDPKFASLMDNICRSWSCAGSDQVVGSVGLGIMDALSTPSYVFEGGNSGIARALFHNLEKSGSGRCQTSAFVWKVEKQGNGGSVVYSDKAQRLHRIEARHVVVCTPPFITRRIVSGLPDKLLKNFAKLEYGAIVVGNFCMKKKVFNNPYQSFADGNFPFSQMIMAETPYQIKGSYKPEMGSVLTVYHPFCTGAAGRARLLGTDRKKLAESLVKRLGELVEGFQGSLEEVVLTRWGHAFVIPRAGVSEALSEIKGVNPEWMTFAHSTAAGYQSLGGAIHSAKYASDRCLGVRHQS